MSRVTIIPAIMAKELGDLEHKLRQLEPWAPAVHIDVADGRLVASQTLTYPEMAPVLAQVQVPVELHLMVADPWPIVRQAAADCQRLYVPAETLSETETFFDQLKNGSPLGLAFNLETGWGQWQALLKELPAVMLMAIEPGAQGRPFDSRVLPRLAWLRQAAGKDQILAVDGGLNLETLRQVLEAGANQLVVGSAIWQAADPQAAYQRLSDLTT